MSNFAVQSCGLKVRCGSECSVTRSGWTINVDKLILALSFLVTTEDGMLKCFDIRKDSTAGSSAVVWEVKAHAQVSPPTGIACRMQQTVCRCCV